MDNKELLIIADSVSREKNIPREDVLASLAEGIETSLRKDFPEGASIYVSIDKDTGVISAYRVFELVDEITDFESQMLHNEVEDEIVEDNYAYDQFDFVMNRQKFNITKQVALQKIKQNAKDQQIQDLLSLDSQLFTGTVKVARKEHLIVDIRGLDITIPRKNLLPKDKFKVSDSITFTLELDKNQYFGTRTNEDFVMEVFKKEVSEIESNDIEIVSVARIPGFRSKVLLRSNVRGLDPIKTCVGYRGITIKNIQNTIGGEYLDLIQDQDDDIQVLIQAIQPVSILSVMVDEDNHIMEISVSNDELEKALGRDNSNIELISQLIGWTIKVYSEDQWEHKKSDEEVATIIQFQQALNCDAEIAQTLWDSGFSSIEEVAYVHIDEFMNVNFNRETIDNLQSNAKEFLSNINNKALTDGIMDLVTLGFSLEEIEKLQKEMVYNNASIADLGTFDLTDILPINEDKAQKIIMEARSKDERFQE